jgi:hypothetical protein
MPTLRTDGIDSSAQDHLSATGTEQESCGAILRPLGFRRSVGLALSLRGFGPLFALCIAHFYPFHIWPAGSDDSCLRVKPVNGTVCIGGCFVPLIWRPTQPVLSS